MLHELDMEMERRNLRFVRYADDFSIYCKTENEARKTGNSIFLYLRDQLKLPINREKGEERYSPSANLQNIGLRFRIHVSKRGKG
jgi:retron-type reverse transcriptase